MDQTTKDILLQVEKLLRTTLESMPSRQADSVVEACANILKSITEITYD